MNGTETQARPESGDFPSFSFPGGYQILFVAADGGVLCPDCANSKEAKQAEEDCPDDEQWRIVDQFVHWEGEPTNCENCNKEFESEYAQGRMSQ